MHTVAGMQHKNHSYSGAFYEIQCKTVIVLYVDLYRSTILTNYMYIKLFVWFMVFHSKSHIIVNYANVQYKKYTLILLLLNSLQTKELTRMSLLTVGIQIEQILKLCSQGQKGVKYKCADEYTHTHTHTYIYIYIYIYIRRTPYCLTINEPVSYTIYDSRTGVQISIMKIFIKKLLQCLTSLHFN